IQPGLLLAVVLSSVDRNRLSGFDRVELLKARSRLISHLQAELYADIHSVSDAVSDLDRFEHRDGFYITASEVQAALTLTRRAGEMHTDLAFQLRDRLPGVWRALHDGLIDLAKARVLSDQTCHLPEELAGRVCDAALERAPDQTTGQLRARIQRLIISIDPASARDRYEEKLKDRRVLSEMTDAGTANLHGLDLPPSGAHAAMRRINRMARSLKAKGDKRPIDQIRADILLDLLTGRNQDQSRGADRGVVDVRVDMTTLAGIDDHPGEIPGFGPVIADVARRIVDEQPDSEWRIVTTDDNGHPVGVVTTRRRPTTSQKRIVETRNPTCVYPGCRIDSAKCDLNHEVPWADARHTTCTELGPLCRHHHNNHHRRGWNLKQTKPGRYRWTSPLGHTYTTGPDPP
ncbi:MAG: DUF222 domain-containing protein, partial [Acidimicrobiia bacterium]